MSDLEVLAALLALGAFHGINPGMGWLFAVALGLQERRRGAVLEALGPIALGHALSIGAVALAAAIIRDAAPLARVRWPVGAALIAFGAYKLVRSRHPQWVGMRVGFKDLVAWSFLVASAHGAGLMLVPVLLGWAGGAAAGHEGEAVASRAHQAAHGADLAGHAAGLGRVGATPLLALVATLVHAFGFLAVTCVVAVVVYQKVGLGILRKAWFNLDTVWSLALMATGALTLVL